MSLEKDVRNLAQTTQPLQLRIKPCARKTYITKIEDGVVFLSVKEPPEDGKANTAIIKYFKKLLERDVELIGKKGRNKLLKIK